MKIYSWNMWFSNTRFAEARTFIENSGADIFCLQEVPTAFIEELKALPYHLAYAPEVDRLFKGETSTQYIAILSRYPIRDVGPIELPYYEPHLPLRTKVFATLMVSIGLWGWGRGNRHALYADLETPRGGVRVFNSHLPLLAPRIRA
ncbi:MAG: endonuclease/exonuclease/phosphatase family protein, partial [Minisyncoccia bacterium]